MLSCFVALQWHESCNRHVQLIGSCTHEFAFYCDMTELFTLSLKNPQRRAYKLVCHRYTCTSEARLCARNVRGEGCFESTLTVLCKPYLRIMLKVQLASQVLRWKPCISLLLRCYHLQPAKKIGLNRPVLHC